MWRRFQRAASIQACDENHVISGEVLVQLVEALYAKDRAQSARSMRLRDSDQQSNVALARTCELPAHFMY